MKIRGFRVELDEVETVLAGHDDVKQCAVVLAGEDERRCRRCLRRVPERRSGTEGIRSYLAQALTGAHDSSGLRDLAGTLRSRLAARSTGKHFHCGRRNGFSRGIEFESPSTEMELRLAEIWRRVLNVWPIGASDNFFALGADSLDATRLLTLVEEHFGIEAPASLLWRVPTLARMAFVLENRELPSDVRQGFGAVVPLQPHGSRIPFFCFPGNDNPAFFMPLAMSLGNEQPFYAVRDPRPFAERGAYTVEQAADRLVQAIRQVQQAGPYVLGGHCFGGLAAFEAARRLTASGEAVGKVILIDVSAPGYPKVVRKWKKYLQVAMGVLRGERRVTGAEARLHFQVLSNSVRERAASWTRRAMREHAAYGTPRKPSSTAAAPECTSRPKLRTKTLRLRPGPDCLHRRAP